MIVINARFLTQKITGVQRYAIEISNNLPKIINNKKVVFVAPKNGKLDQNILIEKDVLRYGSLMGHLWEQIDLVRFLNKYENPILINFGGIGPLYYKNKITCVHDIIFKHSPESFSYIFQKAYNYFVPISAKNSLKVITVSNYSKDDIIKYFKFNNVEVVHGARSYNFRFLNKKREKMILAVSSLDPRKNFKRVIDAYNLISTDYKLVFVGARSKSFSEIGINNTDLNNDKIIFTGYISDDELVKLYNKASIFVFASLFEGFGIPPLEAQACGCPCLVSNTTSLPEVYNDSVEYCDPFSVDDIKEKLEHLINDKERRKELVGKGFENIKRFSWQFSADKLVSIISTYIDK